MKNKTFLVIFVSVVILLAIVLSPRLGVMKTKSIPTSFFAQINSKEVLSINTNKPKTIVGDGGEASYPADFSNDRNLVGASHYIFVGKVIGEAKSAGWYTQFAVNVIDNIKGNLQGTVNVGVTGGYHDNVFYVARGNTWLESGATYLFATRYRTIDGSYRLVDFDYPVGWKLLSEDSTLTTTQLQAIAESDSRVKQLEAAYPNEILLGADIYHNNTLNSYVSIHTPPPAPPPSIIVDTAPIISNLASVVGSTSTAMTWTTDKPATSQLLFGPSAAMGKSAAPDTALVKNHAMVLSGLVPGTTYYYEAQSTDASGTIGTSAQQSFTFLGQE